MEISTFALSLERWIFFSFDHVTFFPFENDDDHQKVCDNAAHHWETFVNEPGSWSSLFFVEFFGRQEALWFKTTFFVPSGWSFLNMWNHTIGSAQIWDLLWLVQLKHLTSCDWSNSNIWPPVIGQTQAWDLLRLVQLKHVTSYDWSNSNKWPLVIGSAQMCDWIWLAQLKHVTSYDWPNSNTCVVHDLLWLAQFKQITSNDWPNSNTCMTSSGWPNLNKLPLYDWANSNTWRSLIGPFQPCHLPWLVHLMISVN